MALVVAIIIAFTLLEGPIAWLVVAAGVTIEVGEAALLIWLSRRRRPATGLGTMIGRTALVAVACRPEGQVRIDGEVWAATCAAGCEPGTRVTITGVDGLTLLVAPQGDE